MQKSTSYTIEYVIHELAGKHGKTYNVEPGDSILFFSISRQLQKYLGLTDKQHSLIKSKILKYESVLDDRFKNLSAILDVLEIPLRNVDRARKIRYVDSGKYYDVGHIEITFPFNKKHLSAVKNIANKFRLKYLNEVSKVHVFKYTEEIVEEIVSTFIDTSFEIDDVLLKDYETIIQIKNNPEQYLPTIVDNKIVNFEHGIDFIEKEIGKLSSDNLIKFFDRRNRFGLHNIELEDNGSLEYKIAKEPKLLLDPQNYNLDSIVKSLVSLDRFPLLITVDEDRANEHLAIAHETISKYIPIEQQSVLFRTSAPELKSVNSYIANNKLNNWVDENTKVVYITKNTIPYVLKNNEATTWKPIATLSMSGTMHYSKLRHYIHKYCDLIIYHSNHVSNFEDKNL